MEKMNFPNGFLWGAATSAHQVEGNNENNDWWVFEQGGKIKELSGEAVDHYHRFREDFDIAQELGHNVHRFSIEWSRIEPNEGEFDQTEIAHYHDVIRALKERDMKVMITLFHFTLPRWFADRGGFSKKENIRYFVGFVEKVAHEFGGEVDYWLTVNEPIIYATYSYLFGEFPPQKRNPLVCVKVVNNLALAHIQAYDAIQRVVDRPCIGCAKQYIHLEPLNRDSIVDNLFTRLAGYVINKYFYDRIRGHFDFIGLQYYFHGRVRIKLGGPILGLFDERGLFNCDSCKGVQTDFGNEAWPEGIYWALKFLSRYEKPIIITENGIADGEDRYRRKYIRNILRFVHKAIEERIDVRGYIYWTLMDNFEWAKGRNPRFGLVRIDENLERTIRESARDFAKICKENGMVI